MKYKIERVPTKTMLAVLVRALDHDNDITPACAHRNTLNALEAHGFIISDGPAYGYKRAWSLTEKGIKVANENKI